jgi:GT2 family glycosyltransferase
MKQSYPQISIAVYDDNSTDNTKELENKYPGVNWEFGKENRSYVYARNKFMSESPAKYFCSLDDDSWFIKSDSLAKGIDYLDRNPDAAAIAFDILSPDRPDEVTEGDPVEVNSFIGCGHVVRISNVREVGFYDPPPSYYGGEEKDLCIRLIDKEYKVMLLPGVHVWHDKTNVARHLPSQHRSGVCNDLVFTWRRTPFVILLPLLFAKLASHSWFSMRFKGGDILPACMKGFGDFFRALFRGKIHRRPVSLKAFRRFHNIRKI